MPRRDPDTGKQFSGAKNKRLRLEKREAEVAAMAPRDEDGREDTGAWATAFADAGKPDLENPDTDLMYVRKLQLIALRQMATTPFPTLAQQECWRRIKDMSATVGMTSNRAALEAKVKALEAALAERKQSGAVRQVDGKSISKPPTARGGSRGPRPLPPDPVEETPALRPVEDDAAPEPPEPEEPPTE